MRKAKSAVMYGMETLRVSPDELFKLIESSQGYDGDDYNRWLAGRIIEVAEKDGVQFSQLLAKKFVIVNEILEEVSDVQSIKEEFLDIFKSTLNDTLYSVDFEGLGEAVEVDWFTGLDLDSENEKKYYIVYDRNGNYIDVVIYDDSFCYKADIEPGEYFDKTNVRLMDIHVHNENDSISGCVGNLAE